MPSRFSRALSTLDLEERILGGSSLIALIGVFLPWFSGEWLGSEHINYNGLGFYTSFLGWGVLLINLFPLAVTISPLIGGPVLMRKSLKGPLRLFLALQSTILVLASLSVLTHVTFEFSRMEVRFGIYVTLIGSLVSVLYALLIFQEDRRESPQEVFQHPEDRSGIPERRDTPVSSVPPPPPPPPPPPLQPEEHHMRS
jgi:hypothetical protein